MEHKSSGSIQSPSSQHVEVPIQALTKTNKRHSSIPSRRGDKNRLKKKPSSSSQRSPESSEWMEQHGIEVSDKGRIAAHQERIVGVEAMLKASREELSKNSFYFPHLFQNVSVECVM